MSIRRVALVTCGLLACAPLMAQAPDTLTLETVLQRVIEQHPELQLLELDKVVLDADRARALQRPALLLGADIENVAGTGTRSGVSGAEWTLSLASVLERGGRRAAREALAARRLDALAPRRIGAQLDLLAEAARRYLDLVGAQHEGLIARDDLVARDHMAQVAAQRVAAGAAPVSVQLSAQVAAARTRLDVDRAAAHRAAAWRRLVALWGGSPDDVVPETKENPLQLPSLPAASATRALVERNPSLQLLAAEHRIREARLHLAQEARSPDLDWRAGLRRLEDSDDWALVAGVSVPLGSRARAEPDIRAAQAQLDSIAFEREAGGRRLIVLLAEAQGLYASAQLEVERARDDLLPLYAQAIVAAERAFRAGALSPIEWVQLQNDSVATRRAQLAAALSAQLALIEIQRLTAEPLRAAGAMTIGETP
jgi:outer membrane protein, heavy metal efflux system